MIKSNTVKDLRELTGAGYMACKNALVESNGDIEKATILLREKGISIAKKKASRTASEGIIGSYIHAAGKIGVMIEICCETDFAANTDVFRSFVKDMSMHVAAMSPSYIKQDEVPDDIVSSEIQIYTKQLENENKTANIIKKIVDGKIKKYYSNVCLLEQTYYKDNQYIVLDILNQCIARIGENIEIKRFVRYEV